MKHVPAVFLGLAMVGTMLAACVGEDPQLPATSSSSSSGTTPGSSSGGSGVACSAATPCADGVCVDGYCCNAPCTGLCEACNVKGREGTCSPVVGKPSHGSCEGDADGACAGACDGKAVAACTYPEVECGAKASCAGGTATPASRCKAGRCAASTPQKCALGCLENGCLGVQQIAAGGYPGHTCALLTDGKVRCWGANGFGQLGLNPATKSSATPVESPALSLLESGVKMLAATGGTTCALVNDGSVHCVGANTSGQLGRNLAPDSVAHPEPEPVFGISGATFLSGGSGGSFCAIVADGEIKCWGGNSSGQLGDGSKDIKTSPVSVCAPGESTCSAKAKGAKFVALGDRHGCAIMSGDKVMCWGQNTAGECGQPKSSTPQLIPQFVAGDPQSKLAATYLTAGNAVTCAATTTGGAACWGSNGIAGRIGNCNGDNTQQFSVPQSVGSSADCKQSLRGVTAVSTYDESVCSIADGAVKCWGTNTNGQLGDNNSAAFQTYAATTAIAAGAVQVASGGGANFAVVVDGANRDVRCWGGEADSQCGAGPSMNRTTPIGPTW